MSRNLGIAIVLLSANGPILPQASANDTQGPVSILAGQQQTQSDQALQYWTPERMQGVQPMPLPERIVSDEQLKSTTREAAWPPGPATLVPGRPPPDDELSPLPHETYELNLDAPTPDALPQTHGSAPTNPKDGPYGPFQRWSMQGRYDVWPRFIHGKLFFSQYGDDYICSATVISRSVIATAGHCVSNGSGTYATNFLFCPGYSQNGEMPGVGCWGVRDGVTTSAFHNSGNVDYDYACLITARTGNQYAGQIGDKTGWAGQAYNFSSMQPVMEFGYPAEAPFTGTTIQQVASTEWYEVDMASGGQPSKYIGSDLTGGASGGGWFLSWRHPTTEFADTDSSEATDPAGAQNGPYLNGVNSHKRCRSHCGTPPSTTDGIFWQEMGSPVFRRTSSDNQDAYDIFNWCLSKQ